MTPNVADTKLSVLSLMYEGAEVGRWRVLEQNDSQMPSKQEMLRRVAADPVSQAIVTHVMIDLLFYLVDYLNLRYPFLFL